MLDIAVHPPVRTDDRYEFACTVEKVHGRRFRVGRRRHVDRETDELRFGFEATNFTIRHQPVWDSVYPLYYMTRNGGPLFNRGHDRARIRMAYPVSSTVVDFYTRRARRFGLEIDVDAPTTTDVGLEPADGARVLAFGGGKDSRMVLGVLRELGIEPRLVTAGSAPPDLPAALVTRSIPGPEGVLANRIMPVLMQAPRHLYLGLGLGEAHLETPWQQYYDMASPIALAEWSRMFGALGMQIEMHSPVSVLPYNLTQLILSRRYPELAAGQTSVRPGARSEKNLHVSLIKREHGIDHAAHCDEALFRELVTNFVTSQTAEPDAFGYRNARETFNREMRAIIWRHRAEPAFEAVRSQVPPEWDADWIDLIHDYVAPDLDRGFIDIYREYADVIDAASTSRRIAV